MRALLVIVTAAVAALLLAIGLEALPGERARWRTELHDALGKPVVLIAVGAVTFSALLWCVRSWVLRKRMRDPGPIFFKGLEDGTGLVAPTAPITVTAQDVGSTIVVPAAGAPDGPPVTRLSVYMRDRLTQLRLTVPTAMPGRADSSDFVELLGTTKLDLKQPLAIVGKLLRLVLPTHAYEVRATLLHRAGEKPCGVCVEMAILVGRRPIFRTFWDNSWEAALDRATNAIGATVVPLSRRSERGPWSGWQGKELDDEIFDAYQRFQRLSKEHRYEEAMDALYAALRRDPGNHHVRFQLGLLQEELALYLDALLTYESIRHGLEERILGGVPRRERRELERLQLLARYRATVLLGWGERLADQWVPPLATGTRSKRSQELERVRERLSPILIDRYEDIAIGDWDRRALGFKKTKEPDGIRALFADRSEPAAGRSRRKLEVARLRLLFELCARHDVHCFLDEYTPRQLRALNTEVTYLALQLMPPWARVRAQCARHALVGLMERNGEKLAPPPVPVGQGGEETEEWPLRPSTIRGLWGLNDAAGRQKLSAAERQRAERERRRIERGMIKALQRSTVFLDHYNAACTFAVALLVEPTTDPRSRSNAVRDLADEAVRELESAVRVGGSQKVAAQWDWVLREDPDLSGLRAEPEFLRFESERFPSSQPAPLRPTEIVKLVAARHSAQLCAASAARRETVWHRRAENAVATSPHEAMRWWQEEETGWRLINDLAHDHRFWQTRLEVVRQLQDFSSTHGLGRFAVPRPPYSDEPVEASHGEIDNAARREIQHLDQRISTVHQELENHDHTRQLGVWEQYVVSLDIAGTTLDADTARRLATNRASAWGDLRIAMERRLQTPEDLRAATRELEAAAGALAELPLPLPAQGAAVSRRRRVVVVANRTLDGEPLRAELLRRGREGVDFHVVAPTLTLRGHYDTSDTDAEIDGARRRLREILRWAHKHRLQMTGTIGDPNLGMAVIAEELCRSGADEVLVATLPKARSNWLANNLVQHTANCTKRTIEHVVVDLRVYVTVGTAVAGRRDPAKVVTSVESYLNGTPPLHDFDLRDGCFAIVVNEAPAEAAAAIRTKLRKQFPDVGQLVLVTRHDPVGLPRPAVISLVDPESPHSPVRDTREGLES